jgi:hypothetical protein
MFKKQNSLKIVKLAESHAFSEIVKFRAKISNPQNIGQFPKLGSQKSHGGRGCKSEK